VLPGASRISSSLIRIDGIRGLLFRHFGLVPPFDHSAFVPVVHAQFARGGALALPLAQGMNARRVVTLHGGDVGKDKNWSRTLFVPSPMARRDCWCRRAVRLEAPSEYGA